MFENFFTTYGMLEPPAGFEDYNIPEISINSPEISANTPQQNYQYGDENTKKSKDVFRIIYPEIKQTTSKSDNKTILKGSAQFEKAFEEAVKINPEVAEYKNFLVRTAKAESGFNSHIQNRSGAPYYGYFQMGKSEIQKTTGLSVEEFRNNPVQQILGAVKLYKLNLKTIKAIGVYDLCKEKGFSDDAIIAGAWVGGPGGVKKFIKGLGDPSDSHWYGGKGGTSVGKRMREFNS